MKRILGITAGLCLLLAACGDDGAASTVPATITTTTVSSSTSSTTVRPRPPLPAGFLEALEARLLPTVEAHSQAWMAKDVEAITAFYTPETVHEDTGFGGLFTGDDLLAMPVWMLGGNPEYLFRTTDTFLGGDEVLGLNEAWGLTARGYTFTESDPQIEVDLFDIRDGKIIYWTLYYGLASYEKMGAPDFRMEDATTLLADYAAAWSSGSPEQVAALYAPDAVREDTLFVGTWEGAEAISASATDFWYPGAAWTQTLGFSDSRSSVNDPEQVGAVFDVPVATGDGPCTTRMAVILTASHGSILRERLYWDPETLTACGWAG